MSDLVGHFANSMKECSAEPICVDDIEHHAADQDRAHCTFWPARHFVMFAGILTKVTHASLFEGRRNRSKRSVKFTAEALSHRNYSDGNAARDEAVLNSGGRGFVLDEGPEFPCHPRKRSRQP
jgi:hypothetical protein